MRKSERQVKVKKYLVMKEKKQKTPGEERHLHDGLECEIAALS